MSSPHERRARAMPAVRLALMMTALSALVARPVRALDPPQQDPSLQSPEGTPLEPEEPWQPSYATPAWTLAWERPKGALVATLALELGVLRAGQIGAERSLAGGLQLQALGAGARWPVMIGLGGGNVWLAHATERGPGVRIETSEGTWIPRTTLERSLDLRHVELMARFQPLWGWARPYLEGFFGLAILRQGAEIQDRSGNVIADQQPDRDLGMVYGGTLGVDLGSRDGGITFTTGVKYLRTSPLDRVELEGDGDAWTLSDEEQAIAMWSPFLGLSFVF